MRASHERTNADITAGTRNADEDSRCRRKLIVQKASAPQMEYAGPSSPLRFEMPEI